MGSVWLWMLLLGGCSGNSSTPPLPADVAPKQESKTAPVVSDTPSEPNTAAEAPHAQGPSVVDVVFTPAPEQVRTPIPSRNPERLRHVRSLLEPVVRRGIVPDNPWALGHGMLAFGADVQAGGKVAPEALFAFAERREVDGTPAIGFPPKRNNALVEPHPGLVLKALADAPPAITTVYGEYSVLELLRGELHQLGVTKAGVPVLSPHRHGGQGAHGKPWNEIAWRLHGLVSYLPEEAQWTAIDGTAQNLDTVTHSAVVQLRRDTQFLHDGMRNGTQVQKRGQGLFAYTCGGVHYLTGVAYAVARGHGLPEDRASIKEEVDAYFWRIDLELQAVDYGIQVMPEKGLLFMIQRLKFLGHFLETAHRLAAWKLYEPSPSQLLALDRVELELERTVVALHQSGVLEKMDALKGVQQQSYLDLIGDSAHAIKGINLALGEVTVPL